MDKIPNNKYWLDYVIKTLSLTEKVKNYQVRYKLKKQSDKLKYLIVRIKFSDFTVKMKIDS